MNARVGIIMGSDSDLGVMEEAAKACEEFGVIYEMHVLSAHRSPDETAQYAKQAHEKGLQVIIAGAGGAAHLAGVVAAHTPLPVIGIPVKSKALQGHDSLLSMVQMPPGIPVATLIPPPDLVVAVGEDAKLIAAEVEKTLVPVRWFATSDVAATFVREEIEQFHGPQLLLVKGSRGIRLEEVTKRVTEA